ncbi:hypothetical protein ACWD6R_30110 [Streptomyces sp. NPDC005151]
MTEPASIAGLASEQPIARLQRFGLDVVPKDFREGRPTWNRPHVILGSPLEPALFVHLAGVCPVLADLGLCGVEEEFSPLVLGILVRQPDVDDIHGYGLLWPRPGVVHRGEEGMQPGTASGAPTDPAQEVSRLGPVEQRAFVDCR